MKHRVGPGSHYSAYRLAIGDVAGHQSQSPVLGQREGRGRIVEQHELVDFEAFEQAQRYAATEKAATTGDDDAHGSAADAVALRPAEPSLGLLPRPIFATDPTHIADLV